MVMIAAATVVAAAASGFAQRQVFKTPQGRVENVKFNSGDGGVINVSYDLLSDDPNAVFSVTLEVSRDAGKTFGIKPASLSGDIGPNVRPGLGRKILWDAGKDVESVGVSEFSFHVVAVAGQASPVKGPTAPGAAPPPQSPAANAPATGHGSPMKWVLPLAGGAGAVAAVVAAKGGGSSSSTPTPTPTPTVYTPIALIQVPSTPTPFILDPVQFSGSGSTSQNGAISNYSWDFGDNSAKGSGASTTHAYSNGGTYTVQLTVTDVVAKTAIASSSITVASMAGTWVNSSAGATRTLTFTGTGASISGTYQNDVLDGGLPHPLTATVAASRTLSFSTQGLASNLSMTNAAIDPAVRSFVGVASGGSANGLTLTFTKQ
jgi:hypothetical protein